MKIFQLLAIFLMLLHGRFSFIRADTEHEVAEGGNITVGCQFYFDGQKYVFRKIDHDNKKQVILVETSGDRVCEGRYCIVYKDKTFLGRNILYVTIINVTESDSGLYQCVVERRTINGHSKFTITVTKNAAYNATYTLKPEDTTVVSPTSDKDLIVQTGDTASLITVTTTQHSRTQELVSFHTSTSSESQQRMASASGSTAMYAGIGLAAIVVLLAAALLIFYCNKRHSNPKEPPVNTEHEQIPEPNRVYEEIRDHKNSGSRGVEISTVYVSASFRKPPEDQTSSDLYTLATAPPDQLKVEDSSNKLVYSEVDFPKSNNSTVDSAPRSQTEAVLYSAVQAQSEEPLYSTVSKTAVTDVLCGKV